MARVEASAASANSRDPWLAHFTTLLDRARAIPGVTHASASLLLPLTDRSWELRIQPFGATEAIEAGPSVLFNMVSEDFFSTLGVPVLKGRAFTEADRNDAPPVAIIDETMAERFWPGQDPIGQRVTLGERGADSAFVYRTVVGVTKNVRHYTLREPSRIQVYVPLRQTLGRYGQSLYVVLKSSVPPSSLVATLRTLTTSVDPGSGAWDIHPVSFYLDQSISAERTLGVITIWLAVVASLVTAVGLFGLVTYAVVQRRREIALRLALGARPGEVVRLITWSGASMGLAGIAIGIVGAVALSRFLRAFLYDVQPLDFTVYVLCAAGVLCGDDLGSPDTRARVRGASLQRPSCGRIKAAPVTGRVAAPLGIYGLSRPRPRLNPRGCMPKLTIDGVTVTAPEGATILDAARSLNVDVPTLCWYPKLPTVGNCRICLVSVEGNPKLVAAVRDARRPTAWSSRPNRWRR